MNFYLSSFLPRVNFGRRLEPLGNNVLHGAGQDPGIGSHYDPSPFHAYWEAVSSSHKPAVYMSYVPLKADMPTYFDGLRRALSAYDPYSVVPQIGLYMNGGGLDEMEYGVYDHEVAEGRLDTEIETFCLELKRFQRPVYLRIGFEFNGPWNGYSMETFKSAWIRIVTALRSHKLENVATVWCYCPLPSVREDPNGNRIDRDYLGYYPGDEWVDWWSIDLFSPDMFTLDNTRWFMRDAEQHRFPVMIGESTPRGISVQMGDKAWNQWYAQFFDFIRTQPCIKAFCYINWNWDSYPEFNGWGDARIQVEPTILERYSRELAHLMYLHAGKCR